MTDVEVFDIYGRKQSNVSRVTSNESLATTINIADLAAGIYFVKVSTQIGEGAVKRLVLIK